MKTKKSFSFILVVIILSNLSFFSFAKTEKKFSDIDNHWAKNAIEEMSELDIISGYPDGTFRPNKTVSRAEFAKLLATTFFTLETEYEEETFFDVKKTHWAFPYIEASKRYLAAFFPNDGLPVYFPEDDATREDVAVALVKLLKDQLEFSNDNSSAYDFIDSSQIASDLVDEVALAVDNHLINGYTDKTFRPQDSITRGQVATLFNRIFKKGYIDNINKLHLEIDIPEEVSGSILEISGLISKDTQLYLSGTDRFTGKDELEINRYDTSGKHDKFECAIAITKFDQNFTYNLTFKIVSPNGDSKEIKKQVKYIASLEKKTMEEYLEEDENKIEKETIEEISNTNPTPVSTPIPKPNENPYNDTPEFTCNEEDYNFNESLGIITEYIGTAKSIVIPKTIKGKPVKFIAPKSFRDKGLEKVKIHAELETIPFSAFLNNTNLEEIELPNTLTVIRTEAFRNCGLLKITIPANVTLIESHSFRECYNLKEVKFTGDAPEVQPYPFSYVDPFPIIIYNSYGFDKNWFNKIFN